MILTICLNPTLQKTVVLERLRENEVNRSGEHRLDASGKGVNVTRVLTQLGLPGVHLTHAGGSFQSLFFSLAREDGLNIRHVESGSEIRFCTTLVNRHAGTTTEIVEEPEPVAEGTEEALRAVFSGLLGSARALIISGTKAPGYDAEIFPWMTAAAKKKGVLTVLDLRGADLLACLEEGPDLIKPNFMEFSRTFFPSSAESEHAEDPALEEAVREKMEEIYRTQDVRSVLTAGSRRILYCGEDGCGSLVPAPLRPVNTIGCGDAMTAGLTAALTDEKSLAEGVAFGAECAGKNALLLRPGVIRP